MNLRSHDSANNGLYDFSRFATPSRNDPLQVDATFASATSSVHKASKVNWTCKCRV